MARRRSGASSFAALVIAVFALAGLAAFSIYVVATAAVALAVAFGGWLAKKSAEHQARRPAAKLPEPLPPLEAPLPRHAELLPVDPVVFEDLVTTEAEALKVFSVWARQHPGAPRDPTRFVQSTEVGFRFLGRLTSEIEHTTLTWREQAYGGPQAPGQEDHPRDRRRRLAQERRRRLAHRRSSALPPRVLARVAACREAVAARSRGARQSPAAHSRRGRGPHRRALPPPRDDSRSRQGVHPVLVVATRSLIIDHSG